MDAVVGQGILVLAELVDDAGDEAGHADGVDVGLDEFAELLGYCSGGMAEWEGFGGIEVEEDADEDDGEHHVQFVLGVDAVRGFFGFERQGEDVGGEVDVCEVANAVKLEESMVWIFGWIMDHESKEREY